MRRRPEAGITLTEMMIVVVILGILAALSVVGFRRYVGRARTTEAVAMLSEMVSKEQVYYLEFGSYLPLRGDNNTLQPSPNETPSSFFPIDPNDANFESARTATSIANPAGWPTAWRSVGLRPRDNVLYCTYLLNAGGTGQAPPAGGLGAQMLGATGATSPPWYYALAACNLTGVSGFPTNVTVFGLTSNTPAMRTFNDGR